MRKGKSMTLEELEQFATTYEQIQAKADKLYGTLDQLDKQYKTSHYSTAGWFSFDAFHIECGYIDLKGSYDVQGDWGNKDYTLSLQEFIDSDAYLAQYEQKLKERLEAHRQKELDEKKRAVEREQELYLKLKAKYESNQ